MFFNEHPENYFSYAQIEVVDKPDPTGIGMTEKTFKGPLDKQLRDALAYIRNYVIKEYVTKVPDTELAIVEGRNTGVPLIVSSMKNNGSGLPVFETDEERSFFMVTLPIHPLFVNDKAHAENDDTGEKVVIRRNRDDLREQIIGLLKENGNMSTSELASSLGYKKTNDTMRDVINELLSSKKVVYLYPDKPKSRNQKICLNEE